MRFSAAPPLDIQLRSDLRSPGAHTPARSIHEVPSWLNFPKERPLQPATFAYETRNSQFRPQRLPSSPTVSTSQQSASPSTPEPGAPSPFPTPPPPNPNVPPRVPERIIATVKPPYVLRIPEEGGSGGHGSDSNTLTTHTLSNPPTSKSKRWQWNIITFSRPTHQPSRTSSLSHNPAPVSGERGTDVI